MEIQVFGKGVELTQSMKDMAAKKLTRIESLFTSGTPLTAVVVFKVHPAEQSCEITIRAPKITLRAKSRGRDAYESLDLCIDKLEGQMRRVKTEYEKARDKSFGKAIRFDLVEDIPSTPKIKVAKLKKLDLVPMDVEEAIARMDALGHTFFIYLDVDTGLTNVLYAREDGSFGRIEIEK